MEIYQKMYAILCSTVDEVICPLKKIPDARPYALLLEKALLETESLYLDAAERREAPMQHP